MLSPDNRFALVADLGLDRVFVYKFDVAQGKITPNDPPWEMAAPGAGPRHVEFHPNGKFVYAINESQFDGRPNELQCRAWPPGNAANHFHAARGRQAAEDRQFMHELAIHPSGRFLYGSNRGHNSIAIFSIDEHTGRLTPIGYEPSGGQIPRGFGLDPAGNWLLAANQDSANVVVFRIDRQSGRLTPTGITVEVDKPVCVKIVNQ